MTKRSYPFNAWVLGGTFIPKQITFVRLAWNHEPSWHRSESGKDYRDGTFFLTKEEAVAHGRLLLEEQEARLTKQQAVIAKKRANLDKHDDSSARVKP